MKIISVFLILLFAACTKENFTPESALKDFVMSGTGTVVTRSFILERVTGKMQQSFENMSEEDFKKFADMQNIKTESFKVLSKSCHDSKCFVTYAISYLTKKDDKSTFTSEVKKIAEVVEIDKKWYIEDISNIKTYHESLESINPLE